MKLFFRGEDVLVGGVEVDRKAEGMGKGKKERRVRVWFVGLRIEVIF